MVQLSKAFVFFNFAAFLVSLASCRNTGHRYLRTKTTCLSAFALAGFDIFAFDSYPEFFNDESVVQLSQAGTYKGVAAIEEYVRFASPTSPYVLSDISYEKSASVKTAEDPETGECVMTVVVTGASRYNGDTTAPNRAHTRSALLKIFFQPTAFNKISISRINIFFEEPYLQYYFGNLTNTDQTRTYVCEVMKDKCEDTWNLNGLSTIDECTATLAALPAAGDRADISGNTQGCRVLHAAFASTNPKHCPHLSFKPDPDTNGKIKCQTSQFRDINEMFDDEDFAVFDKRRTELGLGNEMGAEICDCSETYSKSMYYRFVSFANRFTLSWRFANPSYCEICNESQ